MIKFIIKGLLRDKSRSLFPVLTVMAGSALTVFLVAFISGSFESLVHNHAIFGTGYVKVMSQAYAEIDDQIPNDLALSLTPELTRELTRIADMVWVNRIRFNGVLDVPDKNGDTRAQGPVSGLGINICDPKSPERQLLNLEQALVTGRMPESPHEILISDSFARHLNIKTGDPVTLISSAADGGLAMANFTLAGTLSFGISAMDHNLLIADLAMLQFILNMPDQASEILGFTTRMQYDDVRMSQVCSQFNTAHSKSTSRFEPVMKPLTDQHGLGELFQLVQTIVGLIIGLFVIAMALVQWNAGLMGTLRRHQEIGVRIALGEPKWHIYIRMVIESILIACFGSLAGTLIGLLAAWPVQEYGITIQFMMNHSQSLFPAVLRAQIIPACSYVGFIPGVLASVLGTLMAGRAIFQRQTAELFKELGA